MVRVNDVGFLQQRSNGACEVRLAEVDVGVSGAFRRLFQGVLLPFVLLFMLLLINRVDLMGEYTNSRSYNPVAWSTVVVVIGLTFMLLVGGLRG